MKKKFLSAMLFGAMLVGFSACDEEVDPTDYSCTINKQYHAVDLGLPSGTFWASCNVGANSPEDCGYYFAWGETKPKSDYCWATYEWWIDENNFRKYNTNSSYTNDDKTVLELINDAARANWGGVWRMPTLEEIGELLDENNCTWKWSENPQGYTVTSKKNGNNIFLPATGYRYLELTCDAESRGLYWSSSLYTNNSNNAYGLYFNSENYYWSSYSNRHYGFPVRPVCSSK